MRLLWKNNDGGLKDNGFSYTPNTFSCGIDWSKMPTEARNNSLPILELLSTQNAGCTHNCNWCGGSRDAFRRINKCKNTMIRKQKSEIDFELGTTVNLPNVNKYHFYSVGTYNKSEEDMNFFLHNIGKSNFKSVSYEQFYLPSPDLLTKMVAANKRTIITLSPESHDLKVAKLAGRGVYTNQELEQWIDKAIDCGIYQVDIWYFIGMPEQDEKSVMQTVDYCQRLLKMFKGKRVHPMICPMIPFLDPASTFFEHPQQHGYRVFYRTVAEHCHGMERASIINRINYETEWLSRSDLIHVGFKAVKRLMQAKAEAGLLPHSWVESYNAKIDDSLDFIDTVHEIDCIRNEKERAQELENLSDEILHHNNMIFFSGVMNQAFPLNRHIGGRWFDELGWEPGVFAALD